jgi:hypothetical protein
LEGRESEGGHGRLKKTGTFLAALVVVLSGLVAVTDALGLGSFVDVFRPEPAPVSYSAETIDNVCLAGPAFLPSASAEATLAKPPPDNLDALFGRPGAAFVGRTGVEVSIQGSSSRTITLTGINFTVERHRRHPTGSSFHGQCGDGGFTRLLEYDLDAEPPSLVKAQWTIRELATRPFRFPWEVSLEDPLQLLVFARASDCTCDWTAEIEWQSGSDRGSIPLTQEGEPLRVVSEESVTSSYLGVPSGWEPF